MNRNKRIVIGLLILSAFLAFLGAKVLWDAPGIQEDLMDNKGETVYASVFLLCSSPDCCRCSHCLS